MAGQRGRLISAGVRAQVIILIAEACAAGARKHRACELLGLSVRTLERWEKQQGTIDKRRQSIRVPSNKITDEERKLILKTANNEVYRDLPPSKIVPLLADDGQYIASESTFYRILREEKLLTHRTTSQPAKHHRPEAYVAHGPNQVWTWDISYLPTQVRGLYFYLYMIMDVYSRKIVGWSVHLIESSEYAALLIKQAYLDEGVTADQLVLHSDNGSPMKGITMLAMLQALGVVPSFSRPSVSDDNPYSEALFKTLKYHPGFPMVDKFANIQAARVWCEKFVVWYNQQHLHSGLKFVTPEQRHQGLDAGIREKRHAVYTAAKIRHPERWRGHTRNWAIPAAITLNPNKKMKDETFATPAEIKQAA